MYTLTFSGWETGFDKVAFTMALRNNTNLSLKDSKITTDEILDNIPVRIECKNENSYISLQNSAKSFGAKYHL